MNKAARLKPYIPHLLAIVLFYILSVYFFSPMILGNKELGQNDILQGSGANQELSEYREETGKEGLWTNSMFAGMPAYLINTYWSGDKTYIIYDFMGLGLPSPANRVFIAMIGFYVLLVVFGVNPYLSYAGGIAYGLNSFFMIGVEAGHIWKMNAIGLMPFMLVGIELTFRRKYTWGFLISTIALALQIRANHYQITYYLLLVVLIYGGFRLWQAYSNSDMVQFSKKIGILIVAAFLSIGVNVGKLWSAYEYGKYSIRGPSELTSNTESTSGGLDRDYAFAWSNGITEPITFIIPNFLGGASREVLDMNSPIAKGLRERGVGISQINSFVKNTPSYWGEQPFTSGPYYLGATIVLLFIIGCFTTRSNDKWWLIVATILGIILSWGDNFPSVNYFLFDNLPGYNKFRAVSNIVCIPFLCIPLLGFLGLQRLTELDRKDAVSSFLKSLAIASSLILIIILGSSFLSFESTRDIQFSNTPWLIDLLKEQRQSMLQSDGIRSLVFVIILGGLIYLQLIHKIQIRMLGLGLAILVLVDLLTVSKRYFNEEDFSNEKQQTYFKATGADQRILNDPDLHYRVLNLSNPFNEARTSYYHSSIGGYHGAKIRRYQDLIENHLQQQITYVIESLQNAQLDFSALGILNMLNTKYLKFGDGNNEVIQNQSAFGNAWFVSDVVLVDSPDEELARISEVNLKNQAVIDQSKFTVKTSKLSVGSISLTQYTPNYLLYESDNKAAGLVVFSEIYYPAGWEAFINGQPTEILRLNYVLRGLELPPGKHIIEFKFKPESYYIGNKIMLFCSIFILAILAFSIFVEARKRFTQ